MAEYEDIDSYTETDNHDYTADEIDAELAELGDDFFDDDYLDCDYDNLK